MNDDRYFVVYDELDYILDNHTGEYMTIDDACNQLNDYWEHISAFLEFFKDFYRMLGEAKKEEEVKDG